MPVHAFIFPGQGSQAVGMGRDLAAAFPAAREVFEEVDETLRQKLSRLMFEGPAEELTLTENTQPALMAHSLAVLRVLEREGNLGLKQKAAVVAGHSLGEYSALAAAGAFALADAARLLKLRGQAMQKAVPAGEGAMAALLGADMAQAQAVCEEAAAGAARNRRPPGGAARQRQRRRPGGDLRPSRGGGARHPHRHRKGIRRAMLLPVSAPFHCALMAPAADAMAEALETTPPARAAGAGDRQRLRRQGHRPGRDPRSAGPPGHRHGPLARMRGNHGGAWALTVSWNSGAGKVLSGLMRRIAPDAKTASAATPADIEALLKNL